MAELSALYNAKIIELAASLPKAARLADADASATAHSKLCGSTIAIDLVVRNGHVADFGQTVKARLLGQAAAAVVGRAIVGTSPQELKEVGATFRAMLKADGPAPGGRWSDLGFLEPVRAVKARHASTLLVFDAIEKALALIEQGQDAKVPHAVP